MAVRTSVSSRDDLVLKGVRVHNLKGVDVTFPRYALTVVSGPSGSGKSSLAFDTLYAEGRRRYVECLSTYTRQFLDREDRPALDAAEGIPPAIAVERKPPAVQARSTVGSATEIHDYLRLIFARGGIPWCSRCQREAREDTVAEVVRSLLERGGKAVLTFEAEAPAARRGWDGFIDRLRRAGFARLWIGGAAVGLDEAGAASGRVEVVVDRVTLTDAHHARIAEGVESAYRFGHDRCVVHLADGGTSAFRREMHCPGCGTTFRPLEPKLFSPNSPLGACPTCQGFGRSVGIDMDRVIPDRSRTLAERPIDPWTKPAYREAWRELRRAGRGRGLPWDVPYAELSESHRRFVEEGDESFYGIRGFFRWLEGKTYKVHVRVFLARYRSYTPCPDCAGAKLRPEALAVRLGGAGIGDVASWPVVRALAWLEALTPPAARAAAIAPAVAEARHRLRVLTEVGLGYLSLERPSRTLSGGEAQRIHLARCLGSGLVDTLYVLDEPSVGLHPADVDRLLSVLEQLKALGNTVVVVEHDPALIAAADHLVDLGPGAGAGGGRVVYAGPPSEVVRDPESLTGRYLTGALHVASGRREEAPGKDGWLVLEGAAIHNLKDLTVRFPLRALSVVTGPSGSGKSSLVEDTLYGAVARATGRTGVPAGPYRAVRGAGSVHGVELVDQSPIGRSPRSNPVTYLGAFDAIRKAFAATAEARARGLKPGHFSFNLSGGRCETCEGAGARLVEMHFLPDMILPCEACRGSRYGESALEIRLRGKNVADVLAMTVDEAREFFAGRESVDGPLAVLAETGLGYLTLGQPAPTLSGGEAQRLKLAAHLGASRDRDPKLLLLDEPTTGLHLHDLSRLVSLLRRLVGAGHTVVCVEHHLELMLEADWIVDLGPGAGADGGSLVAEGPPDVVSRAGGDTARYLSVALAAHAR